MAVVEHCEAASRRGRAADDVHDDLDSAQVIVDSLRDRDTAFGGRYVRRDELIGIVESLGPRTRGREDDRAGLAQSRDDRFPDAFGAARDERPLSLEFRLAAHR
jgi:hypothetical protein